MERVQRWTHGPGDGRRCDGDSAAATVCTENCTAQNRVNGRAVVVGFPFPVPTAVRLQPRFPQLSNGQIAAITVSPSTVNGGATAQGTVSLDAGAPAGGVVVQLSSSNPNVANVRQRRRSRRDLLKHLQHHDDSGRVVDGCHFAGNDWCCGAQRRFDGHAASHAGSGFCCNNQSRICGRQPQT